MKLKIQRCLLVLTTVVLSACSADYMDLNPEFVENDIFGVWTDTIRGQQHGYSGNEVVYRENLIFVAGPRP